ncbi:hypothetical protein BWP39_29560 [Paraburkholderia acidicola]|jgi:hypothetical protein|uniref:Uncharacterized protein n=1 Tax=Paraburkholderia acidicola TaxID=1912599 RepID=A0A2A4ETU5_9BURK|nr:hypothetical protein [Paraburkholderia acidicola]PCE23830.1 hypothetical protein BWP39_29560 [Paraburkholderia acidicola]
MAHSRTASIFRGFAKVMVVAFVANQILTTAFTYVAQQVDANLTHQTIMVFSCVTCGLVTMWLQADARRAFAFAREKGFIKTPGDTGNTLEIAVDCPKRWLVILHIELNPAAVGA